MLRDVYFMGLVYGLTIRGAHSSKVLFLTVTNAYCGTYNTRNIRAGLHTFSPPVIHMLKPCICGFSEWVKRSTFAQSPGNLHTISPHAVLILKPQLAFS